MAMDLQGVVNWANTNINSVVNEAGNNIQKKEFVVLCSRITNVLNAKEQGTDLDVIDKMTGYDLKFNQFSGDNSDFSGNIVPEENVKIKGDINSDTELYNKAIRTYGAIYDLYMRDHDKEKLLKNVKDTATAISGVSLDEGGSASNTIVNA